MAALPSSSHSNVLQEIPEKPHTSGSESTQQDDGQAEKIESRSNEPEREQKGENKHGNTKFWKKIGEGKKFREGQKSDWWFASTGIPLLAATLGPLANVSSIAALVTYWREQVYIDGQFVLPVDGKPFADPKWTYWINVGSLICGFLGNVFLLFNFTQRIRYIIALPATIIFWYAATGMLIALTACIHIYAPPNRPYETYTQGFWYAIAAAALYLICSMLLMVNMLGYFLGHYPDTFALTDAQRTLILQTMVFFIWLAGGAAAFSKIESDAGAAGWAFADALYFADVTILTVGFGDLVPNTNLGRGLVFPFSVVGTITLALIVSSIYKFMQQIGEENIVQRHIERMRKSTVARTVTSSFDLRQREHESHHLIRKRDLENQKPRISAPLGGRVMRTTMGNAVRRVTSRTPEILPKPLQRNRKPRLILLKEEKDRFEAMRQIQRRSSQVKKWYALSASVVAFGILWCVGAVVFWQAEKDTQGMTYFQAIYFCYVSLLTIGYGDLSPKSTAGRCFFVVWSLIAVPTMTILISDMSDTVIDKFKKWSDKLADFTVLPKEGIWRSFLDKHPWLLNWIQTRLSHRAAKKRLKKGFGTMDPDAEGAEGGTPDNDPEEQADILATTSPSLPTLAEEAEQDLAGQPPSYPALIRRLALSIKRVASDLRLPYKKTYSYEEWVEFTRLIRFTRSTAGEHGEGVVEEEEEEGLVDWDWIGKDSPLISGQSESEWLLHRLCESLLRLERRLEERKRRVDGDVVVSVGAVNGNGNRNGDERGSQVLASGANGMGEG